MLNLEHIPIGRLKQAYRLNSQEAGILIAALDRLNCLDLYALWHEAVRFVAAEEHSKKSLYDEAVEPYFPDTSDMGPGSLQERILAKRLLRYFLYSARAKNPREYLQRIFDRVLHFTYDNPDQLHIDAVNQTLDLIYEQRVFGFHGQGKVDIFGEYVNFEVFAKFCSFFDDAVSVNKEAAVLHLFEHGYSWDREVKGLSKAIVERIIATRAAQTEARNTAPLCKAKPSPTAIVVPRVLWEGLEHSAVLEGMRRNKYSDAIIAHVLFYWCDLTNKTEIGRMLIQSAKESSTYLHHVDRLLKKAAALTITSD